MAQLILAHDFNCCTRRLTQAPGEDDHYAGMQPEQAVEFVGATMP